MKVKILLIITLLLGFKFSYEQSTFTATPYSTLNKQFTNNFCWGDSGILYLSNNPAGYYNLWRRKPSGIGWFRMAAFTNTPANGKTRATLVNSLYNNNYCSPSSNMLNNELPYCFPLSDIYVVSSVGVTSNCPSGTNPLGGSYSDTFRITVNPIPWIITQPSTSGSNILL